MNATDKAHLIAVLKSGLFRVYYHDNGACILYKGIGKLDEEDDAKNERREIAELFDQDGDGYTPLIVELLVKALGGKVESV